MALYLYGSSALDVMRHLRSTNGGEIPGRLTRTRRFAHAGNSNRGLNELPHSAQLMLSHVRGRVHVLVPKYEMRARTPRLITHVHAGDLPSGAYLDLGNGLYLPRPQYLVVQLATELDEVALACVMMELCGFYSAWAMPSQGFGRPAREEFEDCTYDLHSALTTGRIASFLARLKDERGLVGARQALKHVQDCAASPMETAVYLLLCLPRRLGGYGFPKPVLNSSVTVTTSSTTERRYPDLYWPTWSVDVEYQSDYAHSGEWKRYRDSRREVELVAERITVLPLTKNQVKDPEAFAAFATSLRRNIGQRSRTLDAAWQDRHREIRRLLLGAA